MTNTKLKFEIPFNLDISFLNWLNNEGSVYKDYINFIYMPSYYLDCQNSREQTPAFLKYNPTNRKDYDRLTKKVLDTNCEMAVLMQKNDTYNKLDKKILKYYIDLGFTHFVVGDDIIAYMLKELSSSIEVIASITKVLTFQDILTRDLNMYDTIILHNWANRALDALKFLPPQYKYTLMVDIACNYKCASWCRTHWFDFKSQNAKMYINWCSKDRYSREVRIFPEDYYLFEPYLTSWKLGFDRGTDTKFIISNIESFIGLKDSVWRDESYYNMPKNIYYNQAILDGYVKLPSDNVVEI